MKINHSFQINSLKLKNDYLIFHYIIYYIFIECDLLPLSGLRHLIDYSAILGVRM
jgi:hypothetical protein